MMNFVRKIRDAYMADRDEHNKWLCGLPTLIIFTAAVGLLMTQVGKIVDHYLRFPEWTTFVFSVIVSVFWFVLSEKFDVPTPADWLNRWVMKALTARQHLVFSGTIVTLASIFTAYMLKRQLLETFWKIIGVNEGRGDDTRVSA